MSSIVDGHDLGRRLRELRNQLGVTQEWVGNQVGVTHSRISHYEEGKLPPTETVVKIAKLFGVSIEWLLLGQSYTSDEQTDPLGLVRWIEHIPSWINKRHHQELTDAIEFFRARFGEGMTEKQMAHKLGMERVNREYWRAVCKNALRSGTIRLTHVERDHELEDQLMRRYSKYGLRAAIIANVPGHYGITLTWAEIVAFLTAKFALSPIQGERYIGFGSGYTLTRLAELSIPTSDLLSGTHWIPLMSSGFSSHNFPNVYTSNQICAYLANKHVGSTNKVFPQTNTNSRDKSAEYQELDNVYFSNLQTVFLSANGIGRQRPGENHFHNEFRSADRYIDAPGIRQAYSEQSNPDKIAGELLGYLIDHSGKPVAQPAGFSAINLDRLKFCSSYAGKVWMVAARRYKAKATLAAIKNGIVNCLVIDKAIANFLLEQKN